jgi:hypothetical protein
MWDKEIGKPAKISGALFISLTKWCTLWLSVYPISTILNIDLDLPNIPTKEKRLVCACRPGNGSFSSATNSASGAILQHPLTHSVTVT